MKSPKKISGQSWFIVAASKLSLRTNRQWFGKGLAFVAVFSLLCSSFTPSLVQATQSSPKIQICHQNGNGTYIQQEINANGTNGHEGHVNDIIPMPAGGCPTTPPTTAPDVTVTIVKYIDNKPVDTVNVTQSFAMTSTWSATNIGSGSGTYSLGPVGFNNANPYQATTALMSSGASYTTSETVDGTVVGQTCDAGTPYAFAGYSTGDTLDAAANASISMTPIQLSAILTNKFIVVHNTDCAAIVKPIPIKVAIQKIWENSSGQPVDAPDNKDDVTFTVGFGENKTATCSYVQDLITCDGIIDSDSGQTVHVTETGTPSGWTTDASTVGDVVPVCPQDTEIGTTCTVTVINKQNYAAPCGNELVANGGFEKPVVTNNNNWDVYPSGTPNLNWSAKWVRPTGTGGQPPIANVELQKGVAGSPHGGAQLTELDSGFSGPATSSGSPDASIQLFQDIPTISGKQYTVSFWTSPRPGTGPADNITKVEMGATTLAAINEDGTNNSDTVWTQHTYLFTATSTGLTRLSFTDMGIGNGLGGYLDDVSVIQHCSSDVTICKKDNHGNSLSGWQVYLKGPKEETVIVNPTGVDALSNNLPAGDYVLEANGSYTYRGDPSAAESDAAYSKRLPSDSVYGGAFVPWVRENDFPTPYTGWLGIQLNHGFTDWGSTYNPTHHYSSVQTVGAGQMKFRILDDIYSDNSGQLSMDIFPILKATTGDNGCATLKNVDYGTYNLGEIMQDGWSNVTGMGSQVVVSGETPTANLVNKCDNNCTSTVTICKKDDHGQALADWEVFLKGDKLETVTLNSNNSSGTNSVNNLVNGQKYLAVASGTWQNRGFETVDAKFTTPDSWSTVLDAPQGGYPAQLLELQANQQFVDWGSYSTAHRYNTVITGNGGVENFRVFDGDVSTSTINPSWYGDNVGNLTIDIYPIYEGTTGDNGCATLADVPYNSYSVDEIMQDGWTNVTGRGAEAIVSGGSPTYNLVNKCSSDKCVRSIPQLHLIKVVCNSFSEIMGNASSDQRDATGGMYSQFKNAPDFGGVSKPVNPSEIPGDESSCARADGWSFLLSSGTANDYHDQVGDLQTVGPTVNGEFATPISGDSSALSPALQTALADGHLWVSEVQQQGYQFAAIRCYNDALNGDNLDVINLGADNPRNIYCIAYNVPSITPCIAQNPPIASGTNTDFKGLTETDPVTTSGLNNQASYGMGTAGSAVLVGPTGFPGAWDGGQNDPGVSEGNAKWVSNDVNQPTNPTGSNPGQNGAVNTWRLFSHTFTIPADATVLSTGVLHFAADNHATAFLDGNPIGTSDSFSAPTTTGPQILTIGTHVLTFAVKNDAYDGQFNPTGLIYNFDFTYCGSRITEGETHHHVTGMKWNDVNGNGIKDEGDSGIENWYVNLAKKVDSFDVDSSSSTGTTSTAVLSSSKLYLIRTSGTFDAGDNITADAEYSERNSNPNWTDLVQNYETYGPGLLDLKMDDISFYQPFNSTHQYQTYRYGADTTANFKVNDVYYPNNVGSLHVDIYEVVDTTTTDINGNYSFDVTDMPGNFTVVEDSGNGYEQTAPNTGVYDVTGNTDSQSNDFGNHQICNSNAYSGPFKNLVRTVVGFFANEELPACGNEISGTKYDSHQNPLFGWTIYLDLNHDGILSDQEPYAVTDSNGHYSFNYIPTGSYNIREVLQSGWTQLTPGGAGNIPVTVYDNTVLTGQDFVNNNTNNGDGGTKFNIKGKIYQDNNPQNGTFDEPESGLQNWVAYVDTNTNGSLDDGEASGVSDSNGDYTISGLVAGCYTVREVLQSSWTETQPTGPEYSYQVGIGGATCPVLTMNGSSSEVAQTTSHWYDAIISTANAAVVGNNFATDATGINFGNFEISRGGGGPISTTSGGSSTPKTPLIPRVLGDTTTIPSDQGQVLGATTTLPRTGSPAWVLMLLVALTVPMYYFRNEYIKSKK